MKKELILFSILFVLLASIVIAQQSTQQPARSYHLDISLVNQEPDPAEPGKYINIRIKFDNNGTSEAREVEVEVLPEYPFSLDPGVGALRKIGTIQSRQKGDVGVIVKFKLRVDKNAVEGENELKIRYRIDKGIWIKPEEFIVDIQTHDAILSVESVSLGKKILEPGSSDILIIKLSNQADSVLKNIKVELQLLGLPFIPIGSSNEKSVYKIDSKKSYEFEFEILANPEADSGVYQVPLRILYSDELGKAYFKNGTIGLIVGAKPDLSVTLDESEIYESGKAGEIIIKVVNKGVTDLKFMNLMLMPTKEYRIISNNEVYLGNIDSDDFETADFDIFVDRTNQDKITIPVILEYKDANNNDFKNIIELELNLYSAAEAKKFGLKKQNGFVGTLIVIIIILAGFFYYKKYYMKKRKKA